MIIELILALVHRYHSRGWKIKNKGLVHNLEPTRLLTEPKETLNSQLIG